MNDLRAAFGEMAADVDADLEAAVLRETRSRRRRNRTVTVLGAVACVVLISAGLGRVGGLLDDRPPAVDPARTPSSTPSTPSSSPSATPSAESDEGPPGPATQPQWDPYDAADAPLADTALTALLPPGAGLAPDVAPGAAPISADPVAGVVVAWSEKGSGTRLLGTDGRWRSAPEGFESNAGTPYAAEPPAISSDGTLVAVALPSGASVLDVTTGETTLLPWPDPVAPPWDWAPGLRWLPGDDGLLVEAWRGPWVLGLDGDAEQFRGHGAGRSFPDALGIDPDGPIHQNDYRRSTLVTWVDDQPVGEAPFVQCERLVAAYGLLACTTGSLDSGGPSGPGYTRSGPVVVDPEDGSVLGYAPIRDPASLYSDNGRLTALGFLDPGTVLLEVEPSRAGESELSPTWHLLAWRYGDGTFERVATGERPADGGFSVAPALVG